MKSKMLFILKKRISKKNIDEDNHGLFISVIFWKLIKMPDKYYGRHFREQVTSVANCTCNTKQILHMGAHLSRKKENFI